VRELMMQPSFRQGEDWEQSSEYQEEVEGETDFSERIARLL
jgi:hypothetical protein